MTDTQSANASSGAEVLKYYERRYEGTRTFTVKWPLMYVEGNNPFQSDFKASFDLRKVDPTFIELHVRHRLFFVSAIGLIGGLLFANYSGEWVVMSGALVGVLVLLLISWRKKTFFSFRFLSGQVAFDICEAGPERTKAKPFAERISALIQEHVPKAAEGQPNPSPGT